MTSNYFPEIKFNKWIYSHFKLIGVMDKQIKNFNELISNASDYLESQLHYSLRTVGNYRRCWKQVRNILDSQGIKQYDPDVGKQILLQKFRGCNVAELSTNEKLFFNSIKMLSDFEDTGHIQVPPLSRKEPIVFNGPIGKIITDFLEVKIEKRYDKDGVTEIGFVTWTDGTTHRYKNFYINGISHNQDGVRSTLKLIEVL